MSTRPTDGPRVVVVGLVVLLSVAAPAGAGAADQGPTLRVDGDADADDAYPTIGAALDAADDGDTVRVAPGTYRESLTVGGNVTLVAPEGAVLAGDGDGTAMRLSGATTAVVDGFTVRGYATGVDARGTTGGWQLRNLTVRGIRGGFAVTAAGSRGDWGVRNTTVRNVTEGVVASRSTGDWRLRNLTVRNVRQGSGVVATDADGAWTLRGATVERVALVGIGATGTRGDWRVLDTTVRNASVGIGARNSTGDWTVRRSTVGGASAGGRYDVVRPALLDGAGLDARDTNGSWTVTRSRFVGNEGPAIAARGSDPAGDATGNWWGSSTGPADDDCTGAVDCGRPLSDWPPETPSPARSPTPTAGATPSDTPGRAGSTGPDTTGERTTTGGQHGFGGAVAGLAALVGAGLMTRRGRA